MKKTFHIIVFLSLISSFGYGQKKATETCSITETDTLSFYVNQTIVNACSIIEADTLSFDVNQKVTEASRCFATEADTLIINMTISGISPDIPTNAIQIYPNPTKDKVKIDFGEGFSGMNGYKLRLINPVGQVIYSTPIEQQTFIIDLGSLGSKGIYFIYVINARGEQIDLKKIVLE